MSIHKAHKGFTLLELLIVIAIFSIMTAILVANQRKFGANIALTNLSYDISLSIRQAQTYGLGIKGSGVSGSTFTDNYGVHFDKTTPTSYKLFVDKSPDGGATPANGVYDVLDDDVTNTYTLGSGITITKLCAKVQTIGALMDCSMNSIDITFKRPNPDARILVNGVNGSNTYSEARICLLSSAGRQKQIEVLTSGQVEVADVGTGECQ